MCRLPGMETVITVSGLTKSFGRTRALDGLDLVVRAGEVHGFLGPNGAGKSTTIRILLGLLRADSGSAELLGGDPWRDAVALHRRLAYVPGDVTLWPTLTGGEIIDLLGRLRGGLDQRRRAELLERFDLDPTMKARAYSKGNRQKVALVAALAADVELLLLDEPTAGLDPLMEAVFRETVEEARRAGRSVLLSSHILAEVEALCDRVSIIRNGRTVESGTLVDLRHLTRTSVTAETTRPVPDLSDLAGVHDVRRNGAHIRCQLDRAGPRHGRERLGVRRHRRGDRAVHLHGARRRRRRRRAARRRLPPARGRRRGQRHDLVALAARLVPGRAGLRGRSLVAAGAPAGGGGGAGGDRLRARLPARPRSRPGAHTAGPGVGAGEPRWPAGAGLADPAGQHARLGRRVPGHWARHRHGRQGRRRRLRQQPAVRRRAAPARRVRGPGRRLPGRDPRPDGAGGGRVRDPGGAPHPLRGGGPAGRVRAGHLGQPLALGRCPPGRRGAGDRGDHAGHGTGPRPGPRAAVR